MKIALYIRHQGLLMMLLDLWEDHEVRIFPEWDGQRRLGLSSIVGDEDIIVSTIPHHELNWLDTEKPVIAYATDPIYPTARPGFGFWEGRKNFIAIGAEDCYSLKYFIPVSDYIPFAVKDYPTYNGSINKVLIVNRKPDQRLTEITRGALHGKMYAEDKIHDVAKMMGDLPYMVAWEPNVEKFRQMYADYKVLFYFSNSPFTIVMYEAMTVGIPVVAYNFAIGVWTAVIEKYFPKRDVWPDEIRRMLKEELDRTPPGPPVDYGNPSFDEIKQRWNDLFEVMTGK